jgi:hypothetical protein
MDKISELDSIQNNIYANLSVAFVYKENMRKDIEKLYDIDKYKYYKKASTSPVYNHVFLLQGGIEREFYAKKALGIILCAEEEPDILDKLLGIIKKHYGYLYYLVKNDDIDKIKKAIDEMVLKPVSPMELLTYESISFYLISKTIKYDETGDFLESPKGEFITLVTQQAYLAESMSLVNQDITSLIREKKGLIKKIEKRIEDNIGGLFCFEDIYYCKDENIQKYKEIITSIFDFEKISISTLLSDVVLTREDIDEIICAYTLNYDDQNLERSTNVLINGIIIKSLLRAYKNVKKMFFSNNKETLYLDMEKLEDEISNLKDLNNNLNLKITTISSELEDLKLKYEKDIKEVKKPYEQEIRNLKSKIEILENELKNKDEQVYVDELNALRETIFSIKNEYIPKCSNENIEIYIKNKKTMIVGGALEWRKKIKDKYPEILTMDGFNENFDVSILNNIDFVFFYVGYMNHATYYKAINIIRSKGIHFSYIGKTNIDFVEKEMIEEFQKLH